MHIYETAIEDKSPPDAIFEHCFRISSMDT